MVEKKGLCAIIAVNRLGFIGLNGKLPWKSSEDLQHFKEITMGGKLLVGYNTAKTLPELPGREIIVDDNPNINYDEIDWCIGGKSTYEKHCHRFTEIHISYINDFTVGDTRYPKLTNLNPSCKIFYYNFDVD